MTQINRGFFFTHVRRTMFANTLKQTQVDGMNAILDGWEAEHKADDDRWLAYALATTYHETDQHMQPINEYGKCDMAWSPNTPTLRCRKLGRLMLFAYNCKKHSWRFWLSPTIIK